MEFDVVSHCTRIKHQAADALSQFPTTGKHCNPADNALLGMSVGSQLKDASTFSPEFLAVCPMVMPRAEKNTPTLTKLGTEQTKDAFWEQLV